MTEDSTCPYCGDAGFVTDRTDGMDEAACLTDSKTCPVVVFEVRFND